MYRSPVPVTAAECSSPACKGKTGPRGGKLVMSRVKMQAYGAYHNRQDTHER